MKKKIFYVSLLMFLFITSMTCAVAKPHQTLRLAIFDNPQPDPSYNENKQQFINSYLAGINTALTVAASKGIDIIEKDFFHENNLTSIINQASNAKTWHPKRP